MAQREANKKGIFTPEQVKSTVDSYWSKYVTGETANQEQAKKVAEASINYLASYGSNKTFNESNFNTKFKLANVMGTGISKTALESIV